MFHFICGKTDAYVNLETLERNPKKILLDTYIIYFLMKRATISVTVIITRNRIGDFKSNPVCIINLVNAFHKGMNLAPILLITGKKVV